jgi:hypothetical protein
MEILTRNRVAGLIVGHHVAYGRYLRSGRPSIDLAPTLDLEEGLVLVGISTASIPVFLHMLAGLGSTHLLTMNHSRSDGTSSHQLSALESGVAVEARIGVTDEHIGENVIRGADKSVVGTSEDRARTDAYSTLSIATTTHCGRRQSQDSDVAILPQPRAKKGI